MIKCYLVKESNELVAAEIEKDLCSILIDSLGQKEEETVYLKKQGLINVTGIIIPGRKAKYKLMLLPEEEVEEMEE